MVIQQLRSLVKVIQNKIYNLQITLGASSKFGRDIPHSSQSVILLNDYLKLLERCTPGVSSDKSVLPLLIAKYISGWFARLVNSAGRFWRDTSELCSGGG